MELSEKIIDIIEKQNFSCNGEITKQGDDYYVEIGQYSPAGNDWWEVIRFDGTGLCLEGFIKAVRQRALDFDINDEMRLWIPLMGEKGVPEDAEVLLEDAKWKKQALLDLSDALEKAEADLPTLSVKEFAEMLAFSVTVDGAPDYDFAIKSELVDLTWYGIKKLNTGFNSSCIDLFADYYGGGKGVYHRIESYMDEEEKENIIRTMILLVLEDEVADEDTLLVVQKLS